MKKIHKSSETDEWFFAQDQYVLSETNDRGIITYANDVFCELAGYTLEELVGQPHNVVRHPDMPNIAFKGLWDDAPRKGFWMGFVKNLRKDGGYYWVYATVIRKIDYNGNVTYLSIRRVPDRSDVEEYTKLYAQLKAKE